jgi:hypothetical protein
VAINSSGPVSLGGAVTGESIALELGLSPTAAIALNDAVVRTLAGIASGAISIGNFYGKSSFEKALFYGTDQPFRMSHAFIHSDKLVILGQTYTINTAITSNIGFTPNTNSFVVHVLVYNLTGTLAWRATIDAPGDDGTPGPMGLVTADNKLLVARAGATTTLTDTRAVVHRFNFATGAYESLQVYGVNGTATNSFGGTPSALANAENFETFNVFPGSTRIYTTGRRSSVSFSTTTQFGFTSQNSAPTIVVMDNAGSMLIQRRIGTQTAVAARINQIGNLAPNSDHSFFFIPEVTYHPILDVTDQPNGIASISKYSSAGVLQWRRRYNNFNVSPGNQNNTLSSAGRVAVVSNGDFIHAFNHRQGNISYLYVARFNTNGGFIWGRKLTGGGAPLGIVLDETADRLYIYTYSVAQIFEYSLSGVFQKAVQITYTDGTQAFTGSVNVGSFGFRAPNNGLSLGVGGSEFIRIQHVGQSRQSRVYNPLPAAVNVTRDQYNASSGTWSYFEPTQSNTFTYTLSALAIGEQASETLSPVDVTTTIDEAISLNTAVNYSEAIGTSTYNITKTLS